MSRFRNDTHGARVGGGLLVAGAAITLAAVLVGRDLGPVVRWVALADVALGASLLAGRGWRVVAILRCLAGAVVLTGLTVDASGVRVLGGDWVEAVTQIGFSLGIVSLLVGDAPPWRIVVGVLAAVPRVGLTLLWLWPRPPAP